MKYVKLLLLDEGGENNIRIEWERLKCQTYDTMLEEKRNLSPFTPEALAEFIKSQRNQTLVALRQFKTLHKWVDQEEIFDFVSILKKIDRYKDIESAYPGFIELEDSEVKLVLKIWESVVKEGRLPGKDIEVFAEIIGAFKAANHIPVL